MLKRPRAESFSPDKSYEGVKKRLRKKPAEMKYKLVISKPISATPGFKEQGKNVFYKDQGGKQRTMECIIQLRLSKENVECSDVSMPLKLTLCYESGEVVEEQHHLSISEKVQCMKIEKGIFHLNFRIDDVSKNHCKRLFRVMIAPKGPNFEGECTPVFTEPVLVKSKKHKPKHRDIGDLAALEAYNSKGSNDVAENRKKHMEQYKLNDILRRQFTAGKMDINLAASALIEYSAKTTMFMNAIVQQQKQFQADFRKYVEPSINYLVADIKQRRNNLNRVSQNSPDKHPTSAVRVSSKSSVNESYCFDAADPSLRLNQTRPASNIVRGSSMQLISEIQGLCAGDRQNSLSHFLSD